MSTKSSSESSNQSSTTNQDNRVTADNGGTSIGQGASVTYNTSFSDEVAKVAHDILDFAKGIVTTAGDVTKSAVTQANANSGAAVAGAQTGGASNMTDALTKLAIPVALIIAGAMIIPAIIRKGR